MTRFLLMLCLLLPLAGYPNLERGLPVLEESEDFTHFRLYNDKPYRMFCWVTVGNQVYTVNLYPGKYSPWYPYFGRIQWECRS